MFGSFGTKRTILVVVGTFTSLGATLAITPPRLSEPPMQTTSPTGDITNEEVAAGGITTPEPSSSVSESLINPDCVTDKPTLLSPIVIPGLAGGDDEDDEDEDDEDEDDEDEDDEGEDDEGDYDEDDEGDYDEDDEGEDDEGADVGERAGDKTGSNPLPATTAAPLNPNNSSTPIDCPPTNTPSKPSATTPGKPASTAAPIRPALKTGSYLGQRVETRYGPLQVKITVKNGKITAVSAPVVPADDGRSRSISNAAIPVLITEALRVQTGTVNGVSGASYTSAGFRTSLAAAIIKAKN
jgi:uncharacterized protein with FMN-binding domain